MSNKSLSKLSRKELLDLLYEQEKRLEELESRNKELEAQIEDRKIKIAKVGSIAEASLALSNVFAEAQKAVDRYLENVQGIVREKQTANYVFPAKQGSTPVQQARSVQQPKPVQQTRPVQQQSATQKPAQQPVAQKPVQQAGTQKAVQQPVVQKPVTQKPVQQPVTQRSVQQTQVQKAPEKPVYVGRHGKVSNGDKK